MDGLLGSTIMEQIRVKIPPGYRRLKVGSRIRKTDMQRKDVVVRSFYELENIDLWEETEWESGVDDWRVQKRDIYIRRITK